MKSGRGRDGGRSTSRKRSPRFFKIVLDSALQRGKLRLPKSLVIEHGESLSNHVRLKVPNGGLWRMDVIKMEGHVWFHDGWPQFAEFYSIRHGYLLVFRYLGNSIFLVLVFDRTEREISYPHKPSVAEISEPREKVKEKEDYDFVEMLDEFPANRKRKSNAASKRRSMSPKVRSKGNESGGTMRKKSNLASCSSSGQENTTALRKAEAFRSENPFFVREIQATYASGCYLAIPASFAGKYLAEMEDGSTFTLRALDGSSWKVNYRLLVGSSAGKFSGGWKAFADAWQLKVGDVCVFELVKQTKMQFKVFIFKS